ncbi:MAG: hypothetical protein KDB53_18505 [Planctomycetes bacterium]|nr:hypothetical protein [Planctomycetota bacterium]
MMRHQLFVMKRTTSCSRTDGEDPTIWTFMKMVLEDWYEGVIENGVQREREANGYP